MKAYKSQISIKDPDVVGFQEFTIPLNELPDKAPFIICWTNEQPQIPPPRGGYDNGFQTENDRKQLIIDALEASDKSKYAEVIRAIKKNSTIINVSWIELKESDCENPNFPIDKDKFPPLEYTDTFTFPTPDVPPSSDEPEYPAPPKPVDEEQKIKIAITVKNPQDIENCEDKPQKKFTVDRWLSEPSILDQLKIPLSETTQNIPEKFSIKQGPQAEAENAVNYITFDLTIDMIYFIECKIEHNIQFKNRIASDNFDKSTILLYNKPIVIKYKFNTTNTQTNNITSDIDTKTVSRDKIRTKILELIGLYIDISTHGVSEADIKNNTQSLIDNPKQFLIKDKGSIPPAISREKDSFIRMLKVPADYSGFLKTAGTDFAKINYITKIQIKNTPCCVKILAIRPGYILNSERKKQDDGSILLTKPSITIDNLKIFRTTPDNAVSEYERP
jgi:hypothetical protein